MGKENYWYNYDLEEYEYITMPDDLYSYVPKNPSARNMYKLLVEKMGKTPLEAAERILTACLPKENI